MEQFATQQQQGSPVASASSQPTTPAPTPTSIGAVSNSGNAAAAPAFQPDENSKTLYVGNLDQSVNETTLQEIFSQTGGTIESVKIIRDKNFAHQGGLNFGFVEFTDHAAADHALQQMNGLRICLQEIKVNWAFTGQVAGKEDTASHYHIFIGDLSPEINDEALNKAFSVFGSMTDARVMWDSNSGKSRGYGFAAYKERADAERAMASMNGQVLGNRAVRCNWASQRGMPGPTFHQHVDIRLQADRGFAFVKLESHDKAASAIVRLAGTLINGRPAKLSWGKDRATENVSRGNHYGYYNNGSGYPMGGHQNNGGYSYHHHNQHAYQQQQMGGMDGVTGSSALAAGSSALPPANVAVGSNGGISQDAYEQFSSFNNGGSR
ncbi:hypothetical protein BGZ80_003402 [Entomortierella chlamydospora]|uniref:RRM domain-containing protein n=1 Tax=Entomortierella chlamydospora TaxID=101097 RepID=A0A9P6N635_9FUNG|nr:hypothetical protein BGZ80_003402 [Entomortierella chlamydospora]